MVARLIAVDPRRDHEQRPHDCVRRLAYRLAPVLEHEPDRSDDDADRQREGRVELKVRLEECHRRPTCP